MFLARKPLADFEDTQYLQNMTVLGKDAAAGKVGLALSMNQGTL